MARARGAQAVGSLLPVMWPLADPRPFGSIRAHAGLAVWGLLRRCRGARGIEKAKAGSKDLRLSFGPAIHWKVRAFGGRSALRCGLGDGPSRGSSGRGSPLAPLAARRFPSPLLSGIPGW